MVKENEIYKKAPVKRLSICSMVSSWLFGVFRVCERKKRHREQLKEGLLGIRQERGDDLVGQLRYGDSRVGVQLVDVARHLLPFSLVDSRVQAPLRGHRRTAHIPRDTW